MRLFVVSTATCDCQLISFVSSSIFNITHAFAVGVAHPFFSRTSAAASSSRIVWPTSLQDSQSALCRIHWHSFILCRIHWHSFILCRIHWHSFILCRIHWHSFILCRIHWHSFTSIFQLPSHHAQHVSQHVSQTRPNHTNLPQRSAASFIREVWQGHPLVARQSCQGQGHRPGEKRGAIGRRGMEART